jgi:hypothetical protein
MKHVFASLLVISLTGCSIFNEPERVPYYPQITESIYNLDGDAVIDTDNIIKSSIVQNRYVPVIDRNAVNQVTDQIFAEVEYSELVTFHDLQSELFHRGVKAIINQFSCELFASQQPKDSIQVCPLTNKIVDNNHGYLPFEQGTRFTQRLAVITRDPANTIQFDFFLKSTHEKSLDSLWGAVHEMGHFYGSTIPKESLVLTVNLNGHKKSSSTNRWHEMYRHPLIFFVTLPSVDQITQRPNEIEAMDFAYRSAKLLVVYGE